MIINDSFRQAIGLSGILTRTELPLFFALLAHADTKNNECYPSIAKLAAEIQASESTVKRILKSLVAKKAITRTFRNRKTDGSQTTNLYTVQISADFWGFKGEQKNKRNRTQNDSALPRRRVDKTLILNDIKAPGSVCQIEKSKSHKAETAPRKEEKAAQIISMDEIRAKYRYAELVKAHSTMTADIINPMFSVISYALNEKRETMPVKKGVVMATSEVVRRIKRLTMENLETIIKRVAEGFNDIDNPGAYLLNCLINFIDKGALNIRREVNRDMQNGIAGAGSEETSTGKLISVGEVKPDGTMMINIIRVGSDQDKAREASPAPAEEVPGTETLCMTKEEAIDRLLSNPGKVDLEALMRLRDSRFRATPAAYTA